MRFQPKSEEEIASANVIAGGDYPFEVTEASEETSKNGNDMIKLRLGVLADDGRQVGIFDYLVGTEKAQFKVRHFAESVGLLDDYERGELSADALVGRTGRCTVGVDKQPGYPEKNVIRDYLKDGSQVHASAGQRQAAHTPALDDDIPFMYEWR